MTTTGKMGRGVGYRQPNSSNRPTVYLEKYYPIEGRTDFYKWVIIENGEIAKDIYGKEMYFDEFNIEQATAIVGAKRRVERNEEKI